MARGWRWLRMGRMASVGRLIVLLCALLPGACGCAQRAGLALAEGPPSVWPPAPAAGLASIPALELFPASGPCPALPRSPAGFAACGWGMPSFGEACLCGTVADAVKGAGGAAAGSCGWRLRFGCMEAAQ